MSNPLLRPSDPRFQKPEVRDAEGKNRFGESSGEVAMPPAETDPYAASAAEELRPFDPRYQVQQQSRPALLFLFGGLGWAAALVSGISLAGLFDIGWVTPLLGVIPAGAAWLLAHDELNAIHRGAIAAESRQQSLHAYWLGLTALVCCLTIFAAMIYLQNNFLPAF